MINLFQSIFAIFLIILVLPQIPDENIYVEILHSTARLDTYREAKQFVKRFTWVYIFVFLTIGFLS